MKSEQAVEEIQLIKEMIEKTKKSTAAHGGYFITWGVLIIAALLVNYALVYLHKFNLIWLDWIVFMGAGTIYSIIYPTRKGRRNNVRTYAESTLAHLWTACGVAFILLGFVFPLSGVYSYELIAVLVSVIAGISMFASGGIYEWSILKWSGVAWWTGAVIMAFLPNSYCGFVLILLVIVGYIYPGIQLNRQYGDSGGSHASPNK